MPELPPERPSELFQIWTVLVGSDLLERLSTVPDFFAAQIVVSIRSHYRLCVPYSRTCLRDERINEWHQ